MVTKILDKIGNNVESFAKKVEAKSGAMAANLIKGGQAATIAGGLITGAAVAEGAVVLKMAENVAELGHQQSLLAEKFGITAEQAGKWGAAADAVGVSEDSMGIGFKTLAKNMENLKLLDNTARLKELNKEMLAGTTLDAKAAAVMELLQHKATDLATAHVILTAELQKAIVKHGAHSLEVLKATKALSDNTFAIGENQDKMTELMTTQGKATTVAAQHAKAILDAAAAARPMQVVFDELGVKINDASGQMRPMNDVMMEIAQKLSTMPDGAEKAGMAIKLFGRSGTDLIPLLDQGQAGIQKFMDQAVLSGKVLDESQVKEATAAYLAHKQLDQAISGVTTQLSIAFLPALTKFLEILVPILHNMADWVKHHEKLLSVLIPLVIIVTGIIGVLITLGGIVAMLVGSFMAFGAIAAIAAPALGIVGAAALPVIIIIAALAAVALGVWFAITHWEQIKAVAAGVWNAISTMVGNVLGVFGSLIDGIVKVWTEFWKNPLYYVGLAVGFVIAKAIQIYDTVTTWIQKMVLQVLTFWAMLPDNLIRIFAEMIVAVSGWADKAVPQFLKAAQDMGGALMKELGKLPGKALSLGADIARGIVKGLTSIPGEIAKGASNFTTGLLDGIKKAAGVKSPSTVFAKSVGIPIAQGIAAGIKAGLPEATNALDALVTNATGHHAPAHHAKITNNPKSAAATGGGTGGGKVVELLQKILEAILNGEGVAVPGSTNGGKGALSPYDVLAAFNHLVEAAQIQRNRGTRAGYVQ